MNKKKDKIFSKWAKKFSVVTELFSKWAKTRCGRRDTTTTIKKKKKTSCCSVVDLKPCHGWGWYIGCGSVGDVQLGRVRRIGCGSVGNKQLCRLVIQTRCGRRDTTTPNKKLKNNKKTELRFGGRLETV